MAFPRIKLVIKSVEMKPEPSMMVKFIGKAYAIP
jgi:hypothetical protein